MRTLKLLSSLTSLVWFAVSSCAIATGDEVDFARDVRPILADRCFNCHGSDDASRQADLRLDDRQAAIDAAAIDLADPLQSNMWLRITSDDADMRMPPDEPLTTKEIDVIKAWLSGGAPYTTHWAFSPPQRPPVPAGEWSEHPIDRFIEAKWQEQGLSSSGDCDDLTLLRRMYLDATGLPPDADVVAEVADRGLIDPESLADRLLASPQFGTRWAAWWLDAARYSDSDGYEKDKPRQAWFYRDWVIDALNADYPYDQFILDQIAGDLRPGADQASRVATGFLRNSMVNEEGGADPEEFRIAGVIDRMDAIGKAVLGLSTACAQCHTHKFDPLTHREYYQLFAALNHCHEAQIRVWTAAEQTQIERITAEKRRLECQMQAADPEWAERMTAWADAAAAKLPRWQVVAPESVPYGGQKLTRLPDGSLISESYAPSRVTVELPLRLADYRGNQPITAVRLDALRHEQLPCEGPGRSIYGTGALSELKLELQPADGSKRTLTIAAAYSDVSPPAAAMGFPFELQDPSSDRRIAGPIEMAIDGDVETAWSTDCGPATRNRDRHAVFVLAEPLTVQADDRLIVTLEMRHGGWNPDDNQNNLLGRIRLSLTGDAIDPAVSRIETAVEPLLGQPSFDRQSVDMLFDYWRTLQPRWAAPNAQIAELLATFPAGTTQLTVIERDKPRPTHVFARGDFLHPAEPVEFDTPDFLHDLAPRQEPPRLQLARWLVDRRSPTTARAVVNRIWQAYFGRGLVESTEDLGQQAGPPSHPELLDYLAIELMDHDWSLKHIHRLILTSRTYGQSSVDDQRSREADPHNRFLARMSRVRLPAEAVRDSALAAAGLLDRSVGGPSVFPPAPRFLFEPPNSYGPKYWPTDAAAGSVYRRSRYIHAYRATPYPPLLAFDMPNATTACVRRDTSNTPVQALVTLNEPQFVTAAAALAIELTSCPDDADRFRELFLRTLGRPPCQEELDVLGELLTVVRQRIAAGELRSSDFAAGWQLPDGWQPRRLDDAAAWFAIARCVLNLDEMLVRP